MDLNFRSSDASTGNSSGGGGSALRMVRDMGDALGSKLAFWQAGAGGRQAMGSGPSETATHNGRGGTGGKGEGTEEGSSRGAGCRRGGGVFLVGAVGRGVGWLGQG